MTATIAKTTHATVATATSNQARFVEVSPLDTAFGTDRSSVGMATAFTKK
jgi:hypothetical protein